MAFDGIVTHAIANELSEQLTGGRILKVYQPTETELIFQVRHNRQNHQLLISAHSSYARIHITSTKQQNPAKPPMFCMVLRKYLVGSFIEEIIQYKNERIIEISFSGTDEIGDQVKKKLIVEIMGKHSNVILIDQDKDHILDSIKHISPNQSRYRTVLPGRDYIYPPDQNKRDPFITDQSLITKELETSDDDFSQTLVRRFMGISPLIAKEVVSRAETQSAPAIAGQFVSFIEQTRQGNFCPVIDRGKKEDFHVFDLEQFSEAKESFDSVGEMLDTFYADKASRDRVKQQVGDLSRLINNELAKNKRKIKKQQQSLKSAERADHFQKQGELLTAHLHLVKQGDEEVTVVDYYDPDQSKLTIHLDPNQSPSENAQRFFKRYQKLKRSRATLRREIRKAELEIDYFERLLQQLENARLDDIEEIRNELREEGYLKANQKKNQRKNKPAKPKPEQFSASDGTTIYVGRNNKQNEYLTMRMANPSDIWLHTKDIPGSHVLIRSDSPTEETLFEAAQLAALFSKASASSSVPVDYTEVKHVRKPNGAKPGYVIYDNQKTLFVTPDRSVIDSLKG